MTKFTRGMVVRHKVMGEGIALNEVEEKGETKIEVRMENGHIEKFYPEELETEEEVEARWKRESDIANRGNQNFDPYF